jgi:hypothetical protein
MLVRKRAGTEISPPLLLLDSWGSIIHVASYSRADSMLVRKRAGTEISPPLLLLDSWGSIIHVASYSRADLMLLRKLAGTEISPPLLLLDVEAASYEIKESASSEREHVRAGIAITMRR